MFNYKKFIISKSKRLFENDLTDYIGYEISDKEISGIFYHGSIIQELDDLIKEFNPKVYGEYDATWITEDETMADEYSKYKQFNNELRCVYKVEIKNPLNVLVINSTTANDIMEYFSESDLRITIKYIHNLGYDGWSTTGSLNYQIYEDIAIFNSKNLYIDSVKLIINDDETDFMSLDEAKNYIIKNNLINDENEI
jgi:hypothetical protein